MFVLDAGRADVAAGLPGVETGAGFTPKR